MGRKPNALIIQYFDRGAKLPDSSNRYQHTCKACGEKFPKGRIDSLTAHLIKKCPALSIQDRQNALLQLNNLPKINQSTENFHVGIPPLGSSVGLPVMNSSWTALETLAEVSRQFNMSEKHDGRTINSKDNENDKNLSGSLSSSRLELHEQYTLENPPVSYDQNPSRKKRGSNKKKPDYRCDNSHLLSALDHTNHTLPRSQNLTTTSLDLDEAAAAAKFTPSMLDPRLLGDDMDAQKNVHSCTLLNSNNRSGSPKTAETALNEVARSFADSLYDHNPGEQQLVWPISGCSGGNPCLNPQNFECGMGNPDVTRTETFARLTAGSANITEFSVEYGNGQKAPRPKVRGRFSMLRRKEVQVVRKKGACIRCRMLKKPCSEETPCNTCKSVESARLWKTPCIRTRVADELEMYSSGLHAVLSHHEIENVKTHIHFQPSMEQVQASHFPEIAIFATFNSLEGQSFCTDGNIDSCFKNSMNRDFLRILDNDNDNIGSKLEDYTKRISSIFFEREPSKFMHTTLQFAQELATAKQDYLLLRALELWSIVHILVDHETSWKLKKRIDSSIKTEKCTVIDQNSSSGMYNLICSQLNAAAECKASGMCKGILNDLERRLLQRSATESFETFLVALITLNCIEKSTWLFKSWEHESIKNRWPLEKSPESIYSQGDKLADMLQMLLRIRNVPPKTYTRPEDGILASDATPIAQEYYKKLNLSYVHVLSKQADQTFDSANSRCFELRYCSRLLLPVT